MSTTQPGEPIPEAILEHLAEEVGLDLTDPSNQQWLKERARGGFSAVTFRVVRQVQQQKQSEADVPLGEDDGSPDTEDSSCQ